MEFTLRSLRVATTVLAFTSLAACSKKKDDPAPPVPTKGMSWTINGSSVVAISTEKMISGTDIEIDGATGSAAAATVIKLSFPNKVGTYNLTSSSDATALYAVGNSTSGDLYGSTAGKITVTIATATNIVGEFNFTGSDFNGAKPDKVISNGKFDIAL
jgi:hypothetical protein